MHLMQQVALSDIEDVDATTLSENRLNMLFDKENREHALSKFRQIINNPPEPIALDKSTYPYGILKGRHRIYLARKYGLSTIKVIFV